MAWKLRFPWGCDGHRIEEGEKEAAPEGGLPLTWGQGESVCVLGGGPWVANVPVLSSLGSNEWVGSPVAASTRSQPKQFLNILYTRGGEKWEGQLH